MESKQGHNEPKHQSPPEAEEQHSGIETFRETHTPIIITDGSASIEFERTEYVEVAPGEFHADQLRITRVEIMDRNLANPSTSSHICALTPASQHYRVTVLCAGKDFEVTDLGGSVRVKFDKAEYGPFPAAPARLKFRNFDRKILGLRIQNSAGTVVHECKSVPGNGSCEIKIHDSHIV